MYVTDARILQNQTIRLKEMYNTQTRGILLSFVFLCWLLLCTEEDSYNDEMAMEKKPVPHGS